MYLYWRNCVLLPLCHSYSWILRMKAAEQCSQGHEVHVVGTTAPEQSLPQWGSTENELQPSIMTAKYTFMWCLLKFRWRRLNCWDATASQLHVQCISTAKYHPCIPALRGFNTWPTFSNMNLQLERLQGRGRSTCLWGGTGGGTSLHWQSVWGRI